jgi:hypothetical protein
VTDGGCTSNDGTVQDRTVQYIHTTHYSPSSPGQIYTKQYSPGTHIHPMTRGIGGRRYPRGMIAAAASADVVMRMTVMAMTHTRRAVHLFVNSTSSASHADKPLYRNNRSVQVSNNAQSCSHFETCMWCGQGSCATRADWTVPVYITVANARPPRSPRR